MKRGINKRDKRMKEGNGIEKRSKEEGRKRKSRRRGVKERR